AVKGSVLEGFHTERFGPTKTSSISNTQKSNPSKFPRASSSTLLHTALFSTLKQP
ncbi:unnamed protein product, partial [Citrullus colocynthis]